MVNRLRKVGRSTFSRILRVNLDGHAYDEILHQPSIDWFAIIRRLQTNNHP